ncbi:hypothetical protein BWG23_09060 [Flavobacterium oreochromis]|nr:hypothetical protein BWG23_09060 [Flavobacterium oreochromis]
MMINTSKIAIITTVINWDLYDKSSQYFPNHTDKYVIDGTEGMHGIDSIYYMMKKFQNLDYDWLIMADEDVLFLESNGVFEIIEYMHAKNYIVCGVRDGGEIGIRSFSPYVINTFFSIINLKKLKVIWDKEEVSKNQYFITNEFKDELSGLKEMFDEESLYEPYYRFYFWLRRKGEKILFLNAEIPFEDKITTLVSTPNNINLLYHTWYARAYGNNEKHTKRIDKIFDLLYFNNTKEEKIVVWKDRTYFLRKFFRKVKKRIQMRLEKNK